MPMLSCIKRLRRDHNGVAAVEFALYLPVLLVLVFGMTEIGYAVVQSTIVEKSLRSGALYAARSELPLTSGKITEIENIVKTGDKSGGSYLVSGWSDVNSSIDISVTNYTMKSESSVLGGNQLPVIRISVRIPYQPILSDVLSTFGIGDYTISLSHEQAHIGV